MPVVKPLVTKDNPVPVVNPLKVPSTCVPAVDAVEDRSNKTPVVVEVSTEVDEILAREPPDAMTEVV